MLTLPSSLTHTQAQAAANGLRAQFASQAGSVVIDASALVQFDSSALAVMLAARREATAAGRAFSVVGMPAQLRQLAGLYGVSELVPAPAAP